MPEPLTDQELQRYARQIVLDKVGVDGQARLKEASVLIIGAGGLGSPLALYLAAAGVGRLGLVDFDQVDLTNLHRQVLHSTSSVGKHKLTSARDTLEALNPECEIITHPVRLTRDNALELISQYDIIADGTDNFATRYLVNDACVLTGRPNVYGSVYQFEGQVTVFAHDNGPCYRCLFPKPPPPGLVPSCADGGILGILPGIIGLMQATEVVKMILKAGTPLVGRLLLFNALDAAWQTMTVRQNPDCDLCGENPTIYRLIDYDLFCGTVPQIKPDTLLKWQDGDKSFLLLDVREPHELAQADMQADCNIPLGRLADNLDALPPDHDTTIVAHCQTGIRSQSAVQILIEAGYRNAFSLAGGLAAWQRATGQSSP